MNRLTNEQRLQIIELYYQNSCSVKNVFRKLRPFYGRHNRPTEQAIRAIVTTFRTRSTTLDINPPTRMRGVRTEENIAAVSASVNENRNMSIRRRCQQLGLCYSTTWKILRKDLGMQDKSISTMREISVDELKKEIHVVLKLADLPVISAKEVREQVEQKLSVSLVSREKEIDNIVMEFIEQQNNAESDVFDCEKSEAASESAEEDDKKIQSKKRPQPTTRKAVPKKKRKT